MKRNKESEVKIAEFKAHLSYYLRHVRMGHSLTILDRQTPVAQVMPYPERGERLSVRPSVCSAKKIRLPKPLNRKVDSLSLLLEERQIER